MVSIGPSRLSRRTVLRGAAAVTGGLVLAGCARTAEPSSGGIEVTDQRGERIRLERPARRVVTIVMPAASMVVALDGGIGKLVGMNASSATAMRDGVLGDFFPGASRIAADVCDADFVPNVESVAALNPDLVIQWGDRSAGLVTPLESAGLNVLGLSYGTQEDLERWIAMFGAVLGRSGRANTLLSRMRKERRAVTALPTATGRTKPKILYLYGYSEGIKVSGAGTYNDFCIRLAGGRNAAASVSGQPAVDAEPVVRWNPDIILMGNFDKATPKTVYGDRQLADVAAVRNRRVYQVPLGGYRWDPPSQESALMWRWLSMVAFPENRGFALRDRIREDYRFLYGREPSRAQIDDVLRIRDNAGSEGYERFRA